MERRVGRDNTKVIQSTIDQLNRRYQELYARLKWNELLGAYLNANFIHDFSYLVRVKLSTYLNWNPETEGVDGVVLEHS